MTMGAGSEPNAHWNKKEIAAPRGNIGLAADQGCARLGYENPYGDSLSLSLRRS